MIVLFLTLSIVYSLTYQKKELIFKSTNKSENVYAQTQAEQWSNIDSKDSSKNTNNSVSISDWVSLWDFSQTNWMDSLNEFNPDTSNLIDDFGSTSLWWNIKFLPGTTEYFGTLDIVNILWEEPEFTLQDSKWNFFAYYWNQLDFISTVQTLGWNVYEMVTESEILQNQLFGDRVSYINLSMFKDIRVIMVIRIDGDVWLLQIPSDKYHYSKDYLKSLFIH